MVIGGALVVMAYVFVGNTCYSKGCYSGSASIQTLNNIYRVGVNLRAEPTAVEIDENCSAVDSLV